MRKGFLSIFAFALLMSSVCFADVRVVAIEGSAASDSRSEILGQMKDAEDKIVALANAVPEEKYTWRPAEGVRSVGEVYWHFIQANYGLPGVIGVKAPADAPKDPKLFTKKADLVAALKKSFEYTRGVVEGLSDGDFEKSVTFRGSETTFRGLLNFINNHTNQHLGQSVAYARMNGIVPPWNAG